MSIIDEKDFTYENFELLNKPKSVDAISKYVI